MEFAACYLLTGSFRAHYYQTCSSSKLYKDLAYFARRWFEEGDLKHLANLCKNALVLVEASARLTYGRHITYYTTMCEHINSSKQAY
ncbi:Phosphate transporter [Nymphaea thermarum]|nr:Phosphate transporter [Nymphaea thermarum]